MNHAKLSANIFAVGVLQPFITTTSINQKFNAAGINIAFPQRDVHLDIKQPIDVCIQNKSK